MNRKKGLSAPLGAGLVILTGSLIGLGWFGYRQAHVQRHHVTLYEKNKATEIFTAGKTVGDTIHEQDIALKPQDVTAPGLSTPVTEGMEIDLGQVVRQIKDVKKIIAFSTHRDYTDTLNVGEIIDMALGKDGLEALKTESYTLNDEEAFTKVLECTVLKPAQDAKVLEGTSRRQKLYPMKKRARVSKVLTMQATAYYPGPEDTWPYASGTSASGLKAGYGVVAVDPRVIRLKTSLYVEGYGYAIAADTGGAIKGNKIDLCFDTYEEAVQFGRKDVKVYILR